MWFRHWAPVMNAVQTAFVGDPLTTGKAFWHLHRDASFVCEESEWESPKGAQHRVVLSTSRFDVYSLHCGSLEHLVRSRHSNGCPRLTPPPSPSPGAYSGYNMMEIETVLRSAPAKVVFVLPWVVRFMLKVLQEYAFCLILGALDRKAWMLWEMVSLEFDRALFKFALEMPPSFSVPLVYYAEA